MTMRGVSGVGKGGAAATAGTRGGDKAGRPGGFSVSGGGPGKPASAATAACAATPAAAVALSLLAAQENGGRAGRDAAARRRAAAILDELRGLQAELLGGRPDPARLARLAALRTGEEGVDGELQGVIRAVVLRARIELARRASDPRADGTEAVS